MTFRNQDLIAVVAEDASEAVVWTIYSGPATDYPFSRFTGSWSTTPELLEALHFWANVQGVLYARPTSSPSMAEPRSGQPPLLSTSGMVDGLLAEMRILDQAYRDRLNASKNGNAIVSPRWPDVVRLQQQSAVVLGENSGDTLIQSALKLARFTAGICDAWDQIEEARLARPYMREAFGTEWRPNPGFQCPAKAN